MEEFKDITPEEAEKLIKEGKLDRIIDIREPWENEYARLENTELIPMGEIADKIESFQDEKHKLIYCHHGNRSWHVCSYLASAGIKNLYNLVGGIDRWHYEVDDSIKTY